MTQNEIYQDLDNMVLHGEYEDFIGSYSGIFSTEWCNRIIEQFDYYQDLGAVMCNANDFDDTCASRFDYSIDLSHITTYTVEREVSVELNEKLKQCFGEYQSVFGTLNNFSYYSNAQKIQKTPKGGGYHIWHCENSVTTPDSNRAVVWMLYLNDDFEGGETEFLYYKKRVQPERGKLLIWPAAYTHTHRGNMVLEGMKYVITGWFHYAG